MKAEAIHQDLNTSFVNLISLVRHLRDLQFTGSIKLEYSSYEAEVIFTPSGKLQAREYDKLLGSVDQGESAFKRILARSREPFGRIHVFPVHAATTKAWDRSEPTFVDDRISQTAKDSILMSTDRFVPTAVFESRTANAADSQTVILATELLLTVKDAFGKTRMNFDEMFTNACAFAAERYAFMAPDSGRFRFENDEIRLSENVTSQQLFAGIAVALKHILKMLRGGTQFSKLLVYTRHRVQQHLSTRHNDYAAFGLITTVDDLLS